jgi:hypothetical protein
MRKPPVTTALSQLVLERRDKEATKQKRSKSEYVELHLRIYSSNLK